MHNSPQNDKAPYQKLTAASRLTGLSQYYLRDGCRKGIIQHIKSGKTYYVNVPALLKQLSDSVENN